MSGQIVKLAWKAAVGLTARFGLEISGYVSFATMLALFPFLIFLVSLAGFIGATSIGQDFLDTLSLFTPAVVMDALRPAVQNVIDNKSGGLLTIGFLLSLYSAGTGVATLRLALNLAYNVTEHRGFWYRKGQDFLIVLLGSLALILASLAIILGPQLINLFADFFPTSFGLRDLWHVVRYAFALGIIFGGVIALHRLLPDASLTLRQIVPGAAVTTVAWVTAASLLTLYFGHFANYAATYGSLGGAIVTLLFFYVSAIIFIYGGEFNAALLARHDGKSRRPLEETRSSAT